MKKCLLILIFTMWTAFALASESCHLVFAFGGGDKPYSWIENGEPKGMDIDIINALTKEAGCTYEWVDLEWQDAFRMLISGEVSSMFLNPTRVTDQYVNYIPESYVSSRYIFTRASDGSPISTIEGLRGKTLFVLEESHSYYFIEDLREEYDINVVPYPSVSDAIDALVEGEGDALITSLSIVATYDSKGIISSGVPVIMAPMALAVGKNNIELYIQLNEAMDRLKASGAYYDILKKWAMPQEESKIFKYLIVALSVIAVIVLLAFLWVYSLRVQIKKKTTSLSSLTKQLQAILETAQEDMFLINKYDKIVWANAHKSDSFNIDVVRDRVAYAFKTASSFLIEQIEVKGEMWYVDGRFADDDNLLVVAYNITATTKFRDEAIISSRLAALGEMSAIMAHELNNPLGLLTNDLEFVKKFCAELVKPTDKITVCGMPWTKAKEEAEAAFEDMGDCLIRIKSAVVDLSSFSRKDNAAKILDINSCVASAVKFSSLYIKKHTKLFTFEKAEISLPVMGKEFHIEQMIINLLYNACHAITDRNQQISCTVKPSDDNKYMTVTVDDQGSGMDEKLQQKAFDAFFTTRGKHGGTGLGLTMLSRIIKEHKGFYEIESSKGQGTKIILYFPVVYD